MNLNEVMSKRISEELGVNEYAILDVLNNYPTSFPYGLLAVLRDWLKLDSIGELLDRGDLNEYVLEDEENDIKTKKYEFVVCDRTFEEDYGIESGDIMAYKPKWTSGPTPFQAIAIGDIVFPAVLFEDKDDPNKYSLFTSTNYEPFSIYKDKIKILGFLSGYRKPDKKYYRKIKAIE